MSPIRQVFYISRVAEGVDERVIRNILALSRRTNRMLDITGCLSYTGRHFAQVLEGREDAIAELLPRITDDRRHLDFRLIADRIVTLREYPLWSMAYLVSEALGADIEAMFAGAEPSSRRTVQLLSRMKPDTVMGAL
jgi:hypothetical protein